MVPLAEQARSAADLLNLEKDWSWLQQPSLAYRTAFDLCAAQASRSGGGVAVFASSPFYARDLARRLSGEVVLRLTCDMGLDEPGIRAALGPEADWERVRLRPSWEKGEQDAPRTVLWAECLPNDRRVHYYEDESVLELSQDGKVLYRWQKGTSWADMCTVELMRK